METVAIQTEGLTRRFGALTAVENVTLSVAPGQFFGFLGPNGAGKSTLLRLMMGLLKPQKGEIFVEQRALSSVGLKERAQKMAFVAQSTEFPFPLSVWEIVEMGRHPFLGRFERMSAKDKSICEKALELCDVSDFKDRFYSELSGGEKQRVLLASALAQTPEALLLDEPTLSLDLEHQLRLFEIIQNLHRTEGLTVIVATHELNLANRFLDRLVLMKNGKIEADGKPNKVLTPPRIQSVLNVEVDLLKDRKKMSYFVPKVQKAVKN
jgi:iron complex transport system ATP-binding protein